MCLPQSGRGHRYRGGLAAGHDLLGQLVPGDTAIGRSEMEFFVTLLEQVWEPIVARPLPFIVIASLLLAAGFVAGRFVFSERLESLKLGWDNAKDDTIRAKERAVNSEQNLEKATDDLRRSNEQLAGVKEGKLKAEEALGEARERINELKKSTEKAVHEQRLAQVRIEALKGELEREQKAAREIAAAHQAARKSEDEVVIPHMSPNGQNILSPAVDWVRAKEWVGVRAIVPKGRVLLLKIEGLGPKQAAPGWSWRMGGTTLGWDHESYNSESAVPLQTWTATEGVADLKFNFERAGEVVISLTSDDGKLSSTKRLRVKD